MKKTIVIILVLVSAITFAQAPQYMNYQGVARNSSGTIINSGNVGLKFEILQGSTAVYSEEQSASPSAAGIFTAAIGSGTNVSGSFSSINWANGPYSIRVSLDPNGGTSFTNVGTSQLLSVPYSLYAEKAGSVNLSSGTGISISSGSIINTAPDQTVNITGTGISSVTGTYPGYTIDVPPPALSYNNTTNELMLTQGTVVSTATLNGTGSNTVSMFANGIASVTPNGPGSNFTVSVQTPTFTGAGATTISGSWPNFLISSPAVSTATPTGLQINSPHTVTTLSANNFSINIQPTNLSGSAVLGAYPDYTINASPSTSITSGGANVVVNGSSPSYTISASTPTIQINSPNTVTSLGLNNYSVTVPSVSVIAGGIASVSGTYPTYSVSVPGPSLSVTGNTLTISQGTAVTTKTITASPWNYVSGVIVPATNVTNDKVAIGQGSAISMLDVALTAGATNTLSPVTTISNFNSTFSGGTVLKVSNNNAASAAIIADNNGSGGDGVQVNVTGTANNGTALQVNHNGIGYAGYFSINNTTSGARLLDLNHSGTGSLIYGVNSNTASTSDALYIQGSGSGTTANFFKSGTGAGLQVSHTGSSGYAGLFMISNASNNTQALVAQTPGSGDAIAAYNTGVGRALYASSASNVESALITNSSSGRALSVSAVNSNDALNVYNGGNGRAVYASSAGSMEAANFSNTGTTRAMIVTNGSSLETALFSNSASGRGMVIQNPTTTAPRALQVIGGVDIMGKTSGSTTFPLVVTNVASTNLFNVRDDGNVGVGVSNPGYRLSVYEGINTLAALYSSQNSSSTSANAHGIYGMTSNLHSLAAGVYGENTGSGPAVYGVKSISSGPAARFEIQATGNSADALFASTNGSGAVVHAVSGPTVAGSSNVNFLSENGHIQTIQSVKPTIINGTALPAGSPSINGPGTDTAGEILFNTGSTISGTSPFELVRVTFNKTYNSTPVVVVTARNSTAGNLNVWVSPTATGFSIYSNAMPPTSSNHQYFYVVIGK